MKRIGTIGFYIVISLPVPAGAATFDVRDYGALGDGKTLDTAALQKAVDAAGAAGGGTVRVPAGKYLTEPFTLASGVDLELAKDAVILISDDRAKYPLDNRRYRDAITARDVHDIKITGSGTIDGQGKAWWDAFRGDNRMPHRPYLIKFTDCQNVEVSGVTLQNSPMFHLVTQNCTDVGIHDVTIHSPANAPNTDGIDPSGWNYTIAHCRIDTGDDDIAIKPAKGRSPGNKNYVITDCEFGHGHGMSVGGGSAGGLDGLTVSRCTFTETDAGIRIKTPRGNGGLLQHATYEDLTMKSVKRPIYIMDWYPERNAPKPPVHRKAGAGHARHATEPTHHHPQPDGDRLSDGGYHPRTTGGADYGRPTDRRPHFRADRAGAVSRRGRQIRGFQHPRREG